MKKFEVHLPDLRTLLSFLELIVLLTILVYGAYRYYLLQEENKELRAQEVAEIDVTEYEDSLEASKATESPSLAKQVVKNTEKPQAVPETKEPDAPSEQELPLVDNTEPSFDMVRVGQTAYPDGLGGTYGSYFLKVNVTAGNEDVLIPMTTTASTGAGTIGFSYSIQGNTFKGKQESEVSCTLRVDNLCKIKPGQSKEIEVTVWLTPNSIGDGNYSIEFQELTYFIGNKRHTYQVYKETAAISLYY